MTRALATRVIWMMKENSVISGLESRLGSGVAGANSICGGHTGQPGAHRTPGHIYGHAISAGDFWIIAARPESPNVLVPWDFFTGRPPHGVRRWLTPLAVIDWPGGLSDGTVDSDCRETFPPLTRLRNCCTYTVGDGTTSFGQFQSIQDAVDALPAEGGQICVLPGLYLEAVRIVNRKNVTITGAAGGRGAGPRCRGSGDGRAAGDFRDRRVQHRIADFAVEATHRSRDLLRGRNQFSQQPQEALSEVVGAVLAGLEVASNRAPCGPGSCRTSTFTGAAFEHG